jgi:hypothetical protein
MQTGIGPGEGERGRNRRVQVPDLAPGRGLSRPARSISPHAEIIVGLRPSRVNVDRPFIGLEMNGLPGHAREPGHIDDAWSAGTPLTRKDMSRWSIPRHDPSPTLPATPAPVAGIPTILCGTGFGAGGATPSAKEPGRRGGAGA